MEFSVLCSVSDDNIYNAFGSIFGMYGNNVVEKIECDGDNKKIYMSEPVYNESIQDEIYDDFNKGDGRLTFRLWESNRWIYEDPTGEEFGEGIHFKVKIGDT